MSLYANQARLKSIGKLSDGAIKAGYCYYSLLNGTHSQALASFQRNLQLDFNRLSQILTALDSMGGNWNRLSWFKTLEGRIAYGVPAHLINLCKIDNIGRVRANKLYEAGIKTAKDIANTSPEKLGKIINMKKDAVEKIIQQAQGL